MGNLCIVNLPIGLEHPKDDPREDPVEMKNALYRSYGMELPDLDARMMKMWLLTAIITQETAASGADTRKAILAPSRLVSISNQHNQHNKHWRKGNRTRSPLIRNICVFFL